MGGNGAKWGRTTLLATSETPVTGGPTGVTGVDARGVGLPTGHLSRAGLTEPGSGMSGLVYAVHVPLGKRPAESLRSLGP